VGRCSLARDRRDGGDCVVGEPSRRAADRSVLGSLVGRQQSRATAPPRRGGPAPRDGARTQDRRPAPSSSPAGEVGGGEGRDDDARTDNFGLGSRLLRLGLDRLRRVGVVTWLERLWRLDQYEQLERGPDCRGGRRDHNHRDCEPRRAVVLLVLYQFTRVVGQLIGPVVPRRRRARGQRRWGQQRESSRRLAGAGWAESGILPEDRLPPRRHVSRQDLPGAHHSLPARAHRWVGARLARSHVLLLRSADLSGTCTRSPPATPRLAVPHMPHKTATSVAPRWSQTQPARYG
jgi:hypothetical protein